MMLAIRLRFLLLCSIITSLTLRSFAQQLDKIPIPSPAQITWQNAELVAVFHYDLHVFDGKKYVQKENRITPIPDYNIFNPTELSTDQWVSAAKDMGAKVAIITATHETGFALYQSDVNPYCLKAVKWKEGKGDIVQDFVNSCHKFGIKPGIYIGIRWNSFYGIHDFKVQGDSEFSKNRQAHYNKLCEDMVEELTSRYGDLAIIWFDGGAHGPEQGGPDVLSIFEKNQPNGLFYHNLDRADIRWGGSESGVVPYPCWGTYGYPTWFANRGDSENFKPIKYGDPEGKYYIPAMSDAPLRGYNGRHEWFWEPNDEAHVFPLKNLMHMYYNSVGHNSSLILGITPDNRGLVPEGDVTRMKEFGDEINRKFSSPLSKMTGVGNTHVIQEDISKGERVRSFVLEGKIGKKWKTVYEGSSIGYKHIAVFPAETVSAVRLVIKQSLEASQIKSFEVFSNLD